MNFPLKLLVQIVSIIAAAFGMVISIIEITYLVNFTHVVYNVLICFLCAMLLLVEIYIFPCFRFFGFLLKNWGKALSYLLMGLLTFNEHDKLRLAAGIVFWILAGFYLIFQFVTKGISYPLAQRGGVVTLSTSTSDYYVQA